MTTMICDMLFIGLNNALRFICHVFYLRIARMNAFMVMTTLLPPFFKIFFKKLLAFAAQESNVSSIKNVKCRSCVATSHIKGVIYVSLVSKAY